MEKFRNKITIDSRVLAECQKKIDKTRFYKLFKMLNTSVSADSLHPEMLDEHDNFFEPRTESERDLWVSCRELAKKDIKYLTKCSVAGQKSAEIRKQNKKEPNLAKMMAEEPKKETIVRGSFIPPTLEEVLEYGKQMNDTRFINGFMCSRATATGFYNHYESQGWLIGNGIHMTNWKSKLRKWANDEEKRVMGEI